MTPTALRRRPGGPSSRPGRRESRAAGNGRPGGARREVSLQDKYVLDEGRILLTGVQGLVRAGARPASRRPPRRPDDRHDDLGLSGLAARGLRPGARAQSRAARRAPRPARPGPERGARRDLRLGQPADGQPARLEVRRRARHVVRQGSRPRSRGGLAAPRQLRGRLAHRRRARRRGRRPLLQVLDDSERVRVAARCAAHAGLLPGQRPGGRGSRPPRLRLLARLRAVGRLQDRHERGRRGRHRRGGARARPPGAARSRL